MVTSSDELPDRVEPPSQELFVEAWQVYRKMVDNDYLYHRGAYDCLRQVLIKDMKARFRFVDVACGDASMTVKALQGSQVSHYTGLDISAQALELAAANLQVIDCESSLRHCDFPEALSEWVGFEDVVWIGLSLHHLRTPQKLEAMRHIKSIVGASGRFLCYEDASPDGETRESWMARWDAQEPLWTAYTKQEWTYVTDHVHTSDFPETDSTWRMLGREAGFGRVDQLYRAPSDLFRVYSFQA